MRLPAALVCFLLTAQYAEAGEAPRVQIVEGEVTGQRICEGLPSSADVAQVLRESVSRRLGRDVAVLARAAKPDAKALKVALDLSLSHYTDNFDDGPIRLVGVTGHMWQETPEEPPPEPALYGFDDHLECDDRLKDYISRAIRVHAQRLADQIMVR